jgi:hypothetical protein
MIRVYVAGAYEATCACDVLDNMRRGMQLAYRVLEAGFAPFVPWFDYHFALIGPMTRETYLEYSMRKPVILTQITESEAYLNVAVLGPANCGKDTVCKWLSDNTPLHFDMSTSAFFGIQTETNVDDLKKLPYGRETLAREIAEYNQSDGTGCRLYRELAETQNLINGIRRERELYACLASGLVQRVLWIERPGYEEATCEIAKEDIPSSRLDVIYNYSNLKGLYNSLTEWANNRGIM